MFVFTSMDGNVLLQHDSSPYGQYKSPSQASPGLGRDVGHNDVSSDGNADGILDGTLDQFSDCPDDGGFETTVEDGLPVGKHDGDPVGISVGDSDAILDGTIVGPTDGKDDGLSDGIVVGIAEIVPGGDPITATGGTEISSLSGSSSSSSPSSSCSLYLLDFILRIYLSFLEAFRGLPLNLPRSDIFFFPLRFSGVSSQSWFKRRLRSDCSSCTTSPFVNDDDDDDAITQKSDRAKTVSCQRTARL